MVNLNGKNSPNLFVIFLNILMKILYFVQDTALEKTKLLQS